jgi:predicted CXXCH cytochrome family protein
MLNVVPARRVLLLVLALGALATAQGCRTTEPSGATTYVGSARCRDCHESEYRSWAESDHHLAMLPASVDAGLRAQPHDDGPMVVRDGQLTMLGRSLDHATDVPLVYALGHRNVEQYVGPLAPGRLQALPLAFDVQRGDWFDLFAGEARTPADWGHWTNRGMTANAQCLFCHTTGYDKGYQPATDTYDTHWVEMGVGCEACHGPGSAHVQARASGAKDPWTGRDPELLLAACGSCHSRRVDRAHFMPGEQPFLDAFEPELLDTDAYHPDGQVHEELYELTSFQTSRMYAEGVRCWNCHDPHDNGTRKPGNELCRTCHAKTYEEESHTHHPAGSPGAQCIGCHMPITVYMQRDPRHDHSFSRPDPEATVALGVPNACNSCHTDHHAAWAAEHVRAWYPDGTVRAQRREVAATIAGARGDDPASVPGLLSLLGRPGDSVHRASAARLLARFPTSSGVTDRLLVALRDPDPLVRGGAAWALAQRPALSPGVRDALLAALDDPARGVRLSAALGLRDVAPDSLPPDAARRLTAANADWRASQELGADTPEANYNLALFAAAHGQPEEAERAYRAALREWPRSIQARHNLAMLLAQQGRADNAAAELETLLATDPVPDSAFALGLLYGQLGRWQDAARALERCLAEDTSYPRARYNRALALAKAGDTRAALDELERAADDPASRPDAVRTLVDLSRQVNDRARLERWVVEAARLDRDAATTPGARELLDR